MQQERVWRWRAGSVQYPEPHMGAFKTAEHPAGLGASQHTQGFSGARLLSYSSRQGLRVGGVGHGETKQQSTKNNETKQYIHKGGLIA